MKTGYTTLLLFGAFLCQNTMEGIFLSEGIGPQILFCVTLLTVLTNECGEKAVVLAAAFSAVQDVCFSVYTGAGTVSIVAVGLGAIFCRRFFAWESPRFLFPFTAVMTFLYNLLLLSGQKLLGAPYHFLYVLKLQPFVIVGNLAFMVILYFIFIKTRESGCRV